MKKVSILITLGMISGCSVLFGANKQSSVSEGELNETIKEAMTFNNMEELYDFFFESEDCAIEMDRIQLDFTGAEGIDTTLEDEE